MHAQVVGALSHACPGHEASQAGKNQVPTHGQQFAAASPAEQPQHWRALWRMATRGQTVANEGSAARDALAAERTFLAWIRTAISLVAVGIVLSKSSLYLAQELDPKTIHTAEVLGSTLVGLGVAVIVAGYWRQLTISVALQQGQFPVSTRLSSLLFVSAFAGMACCFLFVCSTMQDTEAEAAVPAAVRPGRTVHNKR